MDTDNDVNIEGEDFEFDESQIPEGVRKQIEKRARDGYIPKYRYDSTTGKLKDEIAKLSAAPAQAPAPKPVYTRAQLREAVHQGTIDEDQMDEIWSRQVLEQAREEARKEAQQNVSSTSTKAKLETTLRAYAEAVEGLNDPGSDNRRAVEEAYEDLVSLQGEPTTTLAKQQLEAAACRAAFGPLAKLEGRVNRLKRKPNSFSEEGSTEHSGASGSPVKGVPKHLVSYYQPLIDRGMYKDWDAVKAELKYASPQVKQRNNSK